MTSYLSGPFKLPTNKPDKLVVFLHGVGSDGFDLIGLTEDLEDLLPNAVFLSPNAPYPYDAFPSGYQWFSLNDRSEEKLYQGALTALPILKSYIDDNLKKFHLTYKDLILIGFSQGTMMALQLAPRLPEPCAAVIGFSGSLINSKALETEALCKPTIFLCHGSADQVVPVSKHFESVKALKAMHFPIEEYVVKGDGHTISIKSLELAREFLGNTNSHN